MGVLDKDIKCSAGLGTGRGTQVKNKRTNFVLNILKIILKINLRSSKCAILRHGEYELKCTFNILSKLYLVTT